MNPVPEIQFLDFIYPAFDQIVTNLSKLRYRSGGQYSCHLVVRAPYGGGIKGGHYHSQSSEAYFCHTAGLKVVIPATPYDTKGLLLSSLRDEDPIIFLEPKRIYRAVKGEVPDGDYTVPIGKARVAREGTDLELVRLRRNASCRHGGCRASRKKWNPDRGRRSPNAGSARYRGGAGIGQKDRARNHLARSSKRPEASVLR